jgi:hypothetical protein
MTRTTVAGGFPSAPKCVILNSDLPRNDQFFVDVSSDHVICLLLSRKVQDSRYLPLARTVVVPERAATKMGPT